MACGQLLMYVNLSLMQDIFFLTSPYEGQVVEIQEWDIAPIPVGKKTLATATVTRVEQRTIEEWNPVLKSREEVVYTYVSLLVNGKAYVRRAIVGGLEEWLPAKGFHQNSHA